MSKVLVIGCGGVASVAISKCCQVSEVFTELCIASRTKSKCDALAAKLAPNTKTVITTAQVDADDVQQLCDLINSYKPDLVMNIALPYQDLTIMDACLATGVDYVDTANYEPEDTAKFEYKWQWAYRDKFEKAGITEVPTTLTELKEDCQKLQDAGITPFAATYKDAWTLNHAFSCLEGAAVDKNDNMESWVTSMNDGSGSYKTDKSDNVFEFLNLMKENSGSNYMDSDSTAGFTAFANSDAAMLFSGEFSLLNVATINPDLPVGLFAAPVTDDPLDAKLDVDVGVACVINSQTKNKEACLKVLEYLSDNTSKDGWFATTNDAMGEAVPCMPYEGQYSAKYMDDYKAYMNSGANRPWVYQQLPAGSNTEIGNIIQAYMAGSVDKEQALQQLDESNQELLNP